MFFITLIQPNIFLRVVRIYFPLFDTILQFPLSENAYPRSYYFNNQPSRRRIARGKKSPGRIVRRKPSTTRARACIGLIEFDVIKVSRRSSLPPSPHLPAVPSPFPSSPSASPRNNYGLRCSVAILVSALHLYPLVLTCTNILVRIARRRGRNRRESARVEPVRGRERFQKVGGKVGLLGEGAETAAVR